MNRIEIDVITGKREVIELTAEEIAQAQANYAEWELNEAKNKAELPILLAEQIVRLQAQIDALKD